MRALAAFAAALLPVLVFAEQAAVQDPLFRDNSILHASLAGPLTTLVRKRPKDEYLEGALEYRQADGTTVALDVEIRARGNFRHANCDYPPVLVNLKRKQTRGTLFDGQNKLKLVVQCDRSERYEQAVLREYLAYRILNELTDRSFRVRLLSATYVNTERSRDNDPRYAFLIEHKKRLAERLGLQTVDVERTTVDALDGAHLNLTSVFEFLIGNTDFSPVAGPPGTACCHNYVLIGRSGAPQWAIPYDFDQSGFVDTAYAAPNPAFGIRSVRQRVYRGRCINNQHVPASLQAFRDNEQAIYALVDEQQGLKPRVRDSLIAYIDEFYKLVNDAGAVEQRLFKGCI